MKSTILLEILSISISALGILTALYFAFKRNNEDNQHLNNLLSGILLCSSIHFLRNFLISSGWIIEFPWMYGSFSFIYLLAPPLCYLYIRSMLYDETQIKSKDYFHFALPIIQILNSIPYILSSNESKLVVVRKLNNFNNLLENAPFNGITNIYYFVVVFFSILFYSIQGYLILKNKKTTPKSEHFSLIYNWSRWVFLILVTMAFVMIINIIVSNLLPKAPKMLVFFGPLYFLRLALFAWVMQKIIFSKLLRIGLPNFSNPNHFIQPEKTPMDDSTEAESGTLSNSQRIEYLEILIDFFETKQEIYTSVNFNLENLAKATKIPRHHWAFYFQYYSNESMVEMRNRYRIEYAVKLMQTSAFKNYTIEAIAEAAGFGSRTTFFNSFKKHKNESPSDYFTRVRSR